MASEFHSQSDKDTTRESYKYQKLTGADDIRVLVLPPGKISDPVQCRLKHVSLSAKPKYETISYAWGDPSKKCPIDCEGKVIQVTLNLNSALQHFRHANHERALWADAICIDQENLEERSEQVQMMSDIYSHGEQLLIWLGEETEDVSKSLEAIEDLHAYFLDNEVGYPNDQPDRYHVFPDGQSPNYMHLLSIKNRWLHPITSLAKRPWFLRRWVMQEVAKSPKALVFCGQKHIPWIIMADVTWSLLKANLLLEVAFVDDCGEAGAALYSIIIIELVRRDIIRSQGTPLLPLLVSTRQYHCQDPRDVIFSILGVSVDFRDYEDSIIPDYDASPQEVYKNFVVGSVLKKNSLLHLSVAYTPPESLKFNLPSWVPDFSDLDLANPLMFLRNESNLPFHASGETKARVRLTNNNNTFHVVGKVVDMVKDITIAAQEAALPDEANPPIEESPGLNSSTALDSSAKVRILQLKLWLDGCKKLSSLNRTDDPLPPSRFDEYCRTMVCNLTSRGDLPPPEFAHMFQVYLDVLEDSDKAMEKHGDPEKPQEFIDLISAVEMSINLRIIGWRFCNTEAGRIGRVLKPVKRGDIVCVFYGGEVPYVLRPRGDGQYTFVGSCYIHGLMDGEALQIEGVEDQEFAIC
ncbi:heterokaryon incompatibility protein-domain-containing protein [Bisporella sp. PMI_857]|nr:heterokaryon incompatibility protein-domain-containing protein [Bisporella sp. PMI_857]